MTGPSIAGAYALARQAYADAGVDVEAALARLDRIPLSLGCEDGAPGPDALRADADVALAQLPGPQRFRLDAGSLEADGPVEPGAVRPEHFQRWVDWARTRGIGLDFRASGRSAPGEPGLPPGPADPALRRAWIEHCRASRDVSAHLGRSLGTPSLMELRVPDGREDPLLDGFGPRWRLLEALDEVLATPIPRELHRDAIAGAPHGPGSSDFCLAYAVRRGLVLGLDAGPRQPRGAVSARLSAALPFVDGVLLHLPGDAPARLDAEAQAIAQELVRGDVLDRVALAVEVRGAGDDRVAAWVVAARSVRRALLRALLEPGERLADAERGGDAAARLALLDAQASLPWSAVWAHYCESRGAPLDAGWLDAVRAHPRRGARGHAPVTPAAAPRAASTPGAAPGEAERLFRSPAVEAEKERICDVGRRLWQRAYVDGNGGNVSVRVSEHLVLCTPTLVSKGFMRPADLCLVDMDGVQRAGAKRMTSEVLMHLAIYRAQPLAKACVHAHPPHATGFAVSHVAPTSGLVPEMEVFCGEVPVAPYFTPGSPAVGESVARLCDRHNTVLMGNHGAVSWGFDVQDAYFKMEILESYCRTVLVATQLGGPARFTEEQLRALLAIKRRLGIPDGRDV